MMLADPQQKGMHLPNRFQSVRLKPTKVKIGQAPGGGERYAVGFVWEPKSPICPCFAAGTFVCLDFPEGVNHTNRAPRESFRESSSAPAPLLLNTCPILRAVESTAHTSLV